MKIGCGGFMVARRRYFETLPTVEIGSAFVSPPKTATAQAWRDEAPRGFDFSLPASQVITHQSDSYGYAKILARIPQRRRPFCGHFKDTPEVNAAWEATRAVADVLRAKFLVFETPATFYPDSNHLRDMYRFFKGARRGEAVFVWQPRGKWEPRLLGKICADLGLVRAYDPFLEPVEAPKGVRYLRLRGRTHSEAQFSLLRRLGEGGQAYAYFIHRAGWLEAKRLIMGRPG